MSHLVLLHLNGSDASTTFTNDGTTGDTFAATGNAQLDTAQSKFGGASLLLDGSGDYVTNSSDIALPTGGTGWTIDMWVRWNSLSGAQMVFAYHKNGSAHGANLYHTGNTNGVLRLALSSNGSSSDICSELSGSKNSWATNTWYHIALCRDKGAGAYYVYVDGVLDITETDSTDVNISDGRLIIGDNFAHTIDLNGWIDEVNVEDQARYPGGTGFPVPTSEYTPPIESTSADLTLPMKTVDPETIPSTTAALTLPSKTAVGGVFGGYITLPMKTVDPETIPSTTAAVTLPVKTATGSGGIFGTMQLTLPELTSSFDAYTGATAALTLPDDWAYFQSSALLGSTATMAATTDLFLSSFDAAVGPFGMDVIMPEVDSSFTGTVGYAATMAVTMPRLTSLFAGEKTHVATLDVQLPAASFAGTALRGSVGSIDLKLPRLVSSFDASMTIVASQAAIVLPSLTVELSGHSTSVATMAFEMPKLVLLTSAESDYAHARTLVMNSVNLAVTEYSNYAFSSFCEFEGNYLAASSDGVYLLDAADTDEGSVKIDASFVMGDLDFGSEYQKRAPDIYMGLISDGNLSVSVSADQQTRYSYTLGTYNVGRLKQRRVKVGKGIKGKYFSFGVSNIEGSDFEIDTMDIPTAVSSGRI